MRSMLAAVVLASTTVLPGTAARATPAAPTFKSTSCPDYVPNSPRIECGTVDVAEDHSLPKGRTVTLAVAVIHPEQDAARSNAPLLFITGGPGDDGLSSVEAILEQGWVTDRDVVVVDPRGTGASNPYLGCPEVEEVGVNGAPADHDEMRKQRLRALTVCRDRLVRAGVNLRLYNYEQITADLVDVRRALGYEEWNVYGISNGGRVALELVRRHPDRIKSLVFDSSLPPQGNFFRELWPHAKRAFDVLFDTCAAEPHCASAYPNLEDRFWNMIDSLRSRPVTVTVTHPLTGRPTTVVFDDFVMFDVLRGALYETPLLPIIPGILHENAQGEAFDLVATEVLTRSSPGRFFSLGEELSDNCREQVAFVSKRELPRQARKMPAFRRPILDLDASMRAECRVWNVGKADRSFTRPVRSPIPALVLVGSFDPVHPRSSSETIAKGFENSQLIEFPGLGHGTVFAHKCPRRVMRAFLVDPGSEVDAACVEEMGPPVFN